jgi:hypothetical protein
MISSAIVTICYIVLATVPMGLVGFTVLRREWNFKARARAHTHKAFALPRARACTHNAVEGQLDLDVKCSLVRL